MTKIQLRRDTLANFTSVNPVLAEGEMAYETDTKKFKIGDGTTTYTSLDYQGGGGTTITKGESTYTALALGDNLVVTDGVVNANLDEIGSELGDLSTRVTTAEGDITTLQGEVSDKQDKLTAGDGVDISVKYLSNANNLNTVNYPNAVYAKTNFSVSSSNTILGFKHDVPYIRPDTSLTAMENIVKYGSLLIPFEKGFVYVLPGDRGSALGYMDGDIFVPFYSPNGFRTYYTDYNNATGSATVHSNSNGLPFSAGTVSTNRGHGSIMQLIDNAFIKTNSNSSNKEYYKFDISNIDFIQGKDLFICIAQYGEWSRTAANYYVLQSGSPLKVLKYSECNVGKFATTADLTTDAGTPNADAENLLDLSPVKQTIISSTIQSPTKTSELTNDSGFVTADSSPVLGVPVNNCVLAMPTVPTFDGANVTVYAGTKIAIPNGRESGSNIPKVNIVTLSANATINQSTYNGNVTLMLKSDGTIDQTASPYNIVDDINKVTPTAYNWYYCRYSNRHYLASSTGALTPYQRFKIGEYNLAEATTNKYFKVRFPIGFPPDNEFIDVTPAS